jgi:hypothetical protein
MILVIPGSLTPLREQLSDQGSTGLQVALSTALRALDAPLLRGDPQFIVSDPQQDFIPDIDPKGLTKRSRDDDTTIVAHANSGFFYHGMLQF